VAAGILGEAALVQTEILGCRSTGGRGIWYDIDQQLAPAYFAIDHVLFDRISSAITTAAPF
jgi:hypothetical protein